MNDKGVHILLVEDEEAHAELVRRAFLARDDAVNLTVVPNLAAARVQLARSLPSLAIVDLRLPDGDGIELLQNELGIALFPVVIMTSHGDEQIAVEAMKAGALDYVVKSDSLLEQMPRIVDRVLREWGHICERRRAEAALRESESRFRGVFEHTPVALWEADFTGVRSFLDVLPLDDACDFSSYLEHNPDVVDACAKRVRILAVNQAGIDLFDASSPEALLTGAPDILAGEMRDAFLDQLASVYAGARSLEVEATIRTITGKKRDVVLHWAVPPGHEDTYSRVLLSMNDVTESKRLEQEVLEVSGREQRRIGRDLHDGLGQLLAGTRFKIARLEQKLRGKQLPEEADVVAEIDQFVAEAMSQARALAHGLSPVNVGADGLTRALTGLAYSVESMGGVPCRLECPETVYVKDPEVASQVYRIAQEALNNAMRHSRATELRVSLVQKDRSVVLSVVDNGDGFRLDDIREGGMGVRSMRYRARMIRGTIDFRSAPGRGTVVTCQFPVASSSKKRVAEEVL